MEEARASLRRRLGQREADFLTLSRVAICENPVSPYRQLLQLSGCEYGDLERLVSEGGIEAALHRLLREGVYLTVDEFKGRKPVVRGSSTFSVNPERFRNPLSEFHVSVSTSGSRGEGTPVLIDLAFIRDCAVDTFLALHARGGAGWVKAHWQVPGGGAIARLIEFGSFGLPPARWFSQVNPAAEGLHPRYRWSARIMRWASLMARVPLPPPEHVPVDDPFPILQWMQTSLKSKAVPHLFAFASSAVRLCQAALELGIDLEGAQFTVVGEPLTEARLTVIRRTGAEAAPRYAIIECSSVGQGCLAPEAPDEVHLLHDLHALIQAGSAGEECGLPRSGLLLSSLRSTAPFILLNVSMGDQAILTRRACGCPLERLGWETHLHTIRSHEKLTAGGMTFLDSDVIRVLEEILPARFGGAPTDYQLVEEQAEDGSPRLRLLVHPKLGPMNEALVIQAFLSAISIGSGAEKLMGMLWRDAKFVKLERRAPQTTASGKILHLYLSRPSE
ncbi:MAG: hypothetical protein HY695_15495 [Deltaproteobacteria bacterium]|nr:hypothetical protein [Deltaproteobacteria bacterium]